MIDGDGPRQFIHACIHRRQRTWNPMPQSCSILQLSIGLVSSTTARSRWIERRRPSVTRRADHCTRSSTAAKSSIQAEDRPVRGTPPLFTMEQCMTKRAEWYLPPYQGPICPWSERGCAQNYKEKDGHLSFEIHALPTTPS
jgi:hypothetical protein